MACHILLAGHNNDVFDDSNSVNKNVRVVSQNAANVSNIDVDERIRKLENCVAEQKREIERLRKTASHGPAGATRGSGQASGLSQTADGPRGDMAAVGAAVATGWQATGQAYGGAQTYDVRQRSQSQAANSQRGYQTCGPTHTGPVQMDGPAYQTGGSDYYYAQDGWHATAPATGDMPQYFAAPQATYWQQPPQRAAPSGTGYRGTY